MLTRLYARRRVFLHGVATPKATGLIVVIIVLAIALSAVISRAGTLMTNDGPQHVLASMARAAADSDEPFAHVIGASDAVTALGFHEMFQLFVPWLGWQRAYVVTLVILAQAWAFGFLLFVWSYAPQRRVLGLLGFPTALSLTFYLGVLPFQLSLALGLFVLAAHSQLKSDALRTVIVAAALFAMSRAHVLPAALVGVVLVVLTLVEGGPDRNKRLALVLLSGLPAAAVVAVIAGVVTGGDLLPASRPAPVWWPLDARLLHSFLPGPGWRGAVVLVLAVVGIAAALRKGTRRERVLALLATLFIALSWVLPRDLIGWELASARFAPLGFVFALALLPVERVRAGAPAAALSALVVGLSCAGLAWGAWHHEQHRTHCGPALALVHGEPDARLLSQVILDVQCGMPPLAPNVTPLVHLASFYAIDRRTLGEFAHAKSARAHPIVGDPRRYVGLSFIDPSLWLTAASLPPDERVQRVRALARAYVHRPVVLLQGEPRDLDAWLHLGWRAEQRAQDVMLAAFNGCSALITTAGPASDEVITEAITIGADGEDIAWRTIEADGAREPLVIDHLPCGSVWIARGSAICARGTLVTTETRALTCAHR